MTEPRVPPVVTTKVRAPRARPETVARDRVRRLLAASAQRPLTVVCAPAGFGKTTALAEWRAATDGDVAWLSLDDRDSDPRRMWAHLLAALDHARPGAMEDAERALRGGSDLLDTVVPLTINGLGEHAGDGLVVVLDDYHHVTDAACHRLLIALLDAAPPGIRVVVASRTVPPLRLGRRRAAGTLAEIGPQDLSFREGESEALLNESLGLGLTADQIAFVDDRVAGWPAGLSLVASSLAVRADREAFLDAFARSGPRIAEYLVEEVLDGTDPPLREFLRRTSILSRLNASLCQAVLADPHAHELLAEVRRSNLFVTVLDGGAGWIRYHDLFAELLQYDLRSAEPELIPELHLRASRWHEGAGMLEDAIAHASAAGDGRLAARLVHEGNVDLLVGGRYASTRQLIDAIPPERGEFGPFCDALYALSLMHDGAEPMLVYERFEALRGMRAAPGVARTVDQARIWPFFGRIREAVEEGRLAYERYRDEPPAIYHSIAAHLGLTLVFAGEPDSARAVLERHLDAMVYRNSKSWALAALAFCAVEERDGETAEHYAREAVAIAVERGAETAFQFAIAYQALGDVLRFQGRHVEADEALTHAHHVTRRHRGSLQHALTLILHAELRLAQGDRRRARQCATTARSVVDRYPDPGAFAGRLAAVEAMLDRRAHDVLRGSRPTPTELRVLEMLSGDLTLQAIAGELYVSIHTVKSHTQRLYRRLGVRTRADAVAVAYERGLL